MLQQVQKKIQRAKICMNIGLQIDAKLVNTAIINCIRHKLLQWTRIICVAISFFLNDLPIC